MVPSVVILLSKARDEAALLAIMALRLPNAIANLKSSNA